MDTLPPEIVTHILQYLSFKDRQQAALVCTKWNYSSLHPVFLNNELLTFKEDKFISLNDDTLYATTDLLKLDEFKQIIFKTKREFLNLHLKYNNLLVPSQDLSIFTNLGMRIKFLYFEELVLLSDLFLNALTSCANLETLILKNIGSLDITDQSRTQLLKLNSLTFDNVRMSDNTFNILMKCFPNLIDIGICNCSIVVWPQAVRRFYPTYRNPEIVTNSDSDDVFTDTNIVNYLKTAVHIKSIRLEQCSHIFLQLPKHMKLSYFILNSVNPVYTAEEHKLNIYKLIPVLEEQTSLERLDIVCCIRCSLLSSVLKLHNLKHLTVHFSTDSHLECKENTTTVVTNFFSLLSNLKHIVTLNISYMSESFRMQYPSTMFAIPDYTLRSLKVYNSPIENCLKIIDIGTNLRTLKIQNGETLTNDDFKLLFKNLTNLRQLSINNCKCLNDDVLLESPISNLKGMTDLELTGSNLTYQCFSYIKLLDLRSLFINNLSMGKCIELRDMSGFEDGFKEFASYVPSLTSLKLCINHEDVKKIKRLGLKLDNSEPKINLLKSYFKSLKYFVLVFPFNRR